MEHGFTTNSSEYPNRTGPDGLYLTVVGIGDRAVFSDPRATISDVLRGLGGSPSQVLKVRRTGKTLLPSAVLGSSDIRSGDIVEFDTSFDANTVDLAINTVTAKLLSGPRAGDIFALAPGESRIGRAADNDIVIVDPGISRHHAVIAIDGKSVTVADAGSTNGVLIDDEIITRPTPVASGQRVLIGQTWVEIHYESIVESRRDDAAEAEGDHRRHVPIATGTRPHWPYPGERVSFPAAPDRPRSWRRSTNDGYAAAAQLFERSLQASASSLIKELDAEWTARLSEAPSVDDVLTVVGDGLLGLWPRAATDSLLARVGLASMPTRIRCVVPEGGDPELRGRAFELVEQHRLVEGVPATVEFDRAHSVLVAGHDVASRELAYAMLGQLVGLHSPNRLRLWGMFGPDRAEHWDWLKWLPHCGGMAPDGSFDQLAVDPGLYGPLIDRLLRRVGPGGDRDGFVGNPANILLIDGHAEVSNQIQSLISTVAFGASTGVSVVVVGPSDPSARLDLPFGREGTIIITDHDHASLETVIDEGFEAVGPIVLGVDYEVCPKERMRAFARAISPALPEGVTIADGIPAPSSAENGHGATLDDEAVSGLDQLIRGADPAIVLEQWAGHDRAGRLVAPLGHNRHGVVDVDLRDVGPHALVTGQLERFLPAWISAMASNYSPSELNFFLIDSTGDSVFRHCGELPHTIGTVSDVSPLGVKPALATLSAELDRREAVLSSLDCDSVEDLERQGRTSPFPALVVAIDRVEQLGSRRDRNTHRTNLGSAGSDRVVSLDPVSELLSLAERGQQLALHLIIGSATDLDIRLRNSVALHLVAAEGRPSILVVGDTEPVSFTATLTAPRPELTVRAFNVHDTSELGREQLPVAELDDLERLTTLIRMLTPFPVIPCRRA